MGPCPIIQFTAGLCLILLHFYKDSLSNIRVHLNYIFKDWTQELMENSQQGVYTKKINKLTLQITVTSISFSR